MRKLVLILWSAAAWSATTTVSQSIVGPDGLPAAGMVNIRITAPCASGSDYVGAKTISRAFSGSLSVKLVPNDTCTPAGTSYTVGWTFSDGRKLDQVWVVPTSGSAVTVDDVVVPSAPATLATYAARAHASTHASAGSDPVTLTEAQVTGLVSDLGAKAPLANPSFTGNVTITGTVSAANLDAYGHIYLGNWQAALAAVMRGNPARQASIAWIGDSNTNRSYFTDPIRQTLQGLYGNAGPGYVPFNSTLGVGAQEATMQHVSLTTLGTWTDSAIGASTTPGLDGTSTVSTDAATPASKAIYFDAVTTIVLSYYKQTSGGTFHYKVDAGAWTDVDTNAAAAFTAVSIAGLSYGPHTITVEVTGAGTNGVALAGAEGRIDTNGIRLHRLGVPGSKSGDWAVLDGTKWGTALTSAAPDLAVIQLCTNDMGGSVGAATCAANVQTIVGKVRAALPNTDILLVTIPPAAWTSEANALTYVNAVTALAQANNYGYVDIYRNLGSAAAMNARGLYSDTATHFNLLGGRVVAEILTPYLLNRGAVPEPALLQQTGNLLTAPDRLDHPAWTGSSGGNGVVTVTANAVLGPNGTLTAATLAIPANTNSYWSQLVNGTVANNTYAVSAWVRVSSGTGKFQLKCTHQGVANYYSADLTATATWQRFVFKQAFGAGGSGVQAGFRPDAAGEAVTIQVWGVKLEQVP